MTRALVAALIVAAALPALSCQPWYRDRQNLARTVNEERQTGSLLARARAEHAAGHPARAGEILRDLVAKDPAAVPEVWLLLGTIEANAGRAAAGRAYVRWGLRHHPNAAELRRFLAASLVADGLIAQALDLAQPPTIQEALRLPGFSRGLVELQAALEASSTAPGTALARLRNWLYDYGEPDHDLLEAARQVIAAEVWRAAQAADAPESLAVLRRLGPYAREELGHGRVSSALALYAEARRLLPPEAFAPYLGEMERAAAAGAPGALDSRAYALAIEGDAALLDGRLGAAIQLYRRAVASAPWWSAAGRNLASLLDLADQAEESPVTRDWAARFLRQAPAEIMAPVTKPKPPPPADASAWSVAQRALPADASVASFDVRAARATSLFANAYPLLLDTNPGLKNLVTLMKSGCGIDAMAVVDQVIAALEAQGETVLFVQVRDLDEPRLTRCATEMLRSRGKETAVARHARGRATEVEISVLGEEEKFYTVWEGNVVAFGIDPSDRALLAKMTGGSGTLATGLGFAAGLARVDVSALGWAVIQSPTPVDAGTAELIYGQITSTAVGYEVALHTAMASAAEAQASLAARERSLEEFRRTGPPEVVRLASAVKLSTAGAEATLRAAFTDADVLSLLRLMFN